MPAAGSINIVPITLFAICTPRAPSSPSSSKARIPNNRPIISYCSNPDIWIPEAEYLRFGTWAKRNEPISKVSYF